MNRLYIALVHHPVVNRRGEVIAAALTNLDLHDIARAARTYGVSAFFVVTPLAEQKAFAERIVAHWTRGPGAAHIPDRRQALETVVVTDAVAGAVDAVAAREGQRPRVVATCARPLERALSYPALRAAIGEGQPHLLLFGTAWGLAPEILGNADQVLAPIQGAAGYNHLSVRSAVAIVLDRLLGSADAQF